MAGGVKPPIPTGGNTGGTSIAKQTPKPKSSTPNTGATTSASNKSKLANGARSNPTTASKRSNSPNNTQKQPNKQGADHRKVNRDSGGAGNKEKQNGDHSQQQDVNNKSGIADKAKSLSSNATGVDYSDKSMKDQLEHQAADVAMDATPILGQVNSARKALKNYNQAKKDAGGKEGIADKVEDVADDAVDKGIKGVKVAAGTAMAGNVGAHALLSAIIMKMLITLKSAIVAGVSKIAGFIGGVFGALSNAISGALGVATGVGQAITSIIITVAVTTSSVVGYGFIEQVTNKDDTGDACLPTLTSVTKASQSYLLEPGEIAAKQEENATKLWSVYSALGSSKEQASAVLGNLHLESSGLDPTAVETIYTEPFTMGPRKQAAQSYDFKVGLIDASYSARFPAINYVGIGLAQWTNGRNRLLMDYAKTQNVNWYDFDTQVRFMLDGDEGYRQSQLLNFLSSPTTNVVRETERFMNTWIGLSSPNPSLTKRQEYATNYMFILERAEVDTAYADSILSGLNVNRGEGNAAAGAYHQDDGCGKPIKSHYGNGAVDGTGEVPVGLALVPWSRETLPDSLQEFAKNPEDAGLVWGNSTGWANGIIPNQCVALATSYFMRLYPEWNQHGRATTRPFGNGKDTAEGWANHYGESISNAPSGGAVFSDSTTSVYGHTGIVQHVFANGDILIIEQNVRGISGEANGMNYSWGWRVIKKDRYEQASWKFFKPAQEEPQWTR